MNTHFFIPIRGLLLACAMAAAVSTSSPAQTNAPDSAARSGARIEQLKQRLKLTPEQVERARPVLEREAQQMRELLEGFDRNSASARDKRKTARQLKSIRESADRELRGILTSAQMEELGRIREEQKNKLRARRQGEA